jgi:hypothetical protein
MRFLPHLILLATLAAGPAAADVHVWERWETSFTAASAYSNEYAGVTVQVHFGGPGRQTSTVHAFWDGGLTWKVRFAFPEPGTWTFSTTCSNPADAGLHLRTGIVEVTPYTGGNTLYAFGFPRTDAGTSHLFRHWDGEPFFYLADSAWEPWIHLSAADWTEYVDDRAARGFSVVQTANGFDGWWERWPTGGCVGSATHGIPPWYGPLGQAEKYNPAHFRALDDFVQIANARGLVVAVFGLMNAGDRDLIDDVKRRRFARTIAARLQGNAVILSPPVDDLWSTATSMRATGDELADSDDDHYPHLFTGHLASYAHGCDSSDPGRYDCHLHAEPWLDFSGYQSGHMKPLLNQQIRWAVRRAYEMPLYFLALAPAKPVVNLEPLYEMPAAWFPPESDLDDNRYRSRQIGFINYKS